MKEKNRKTLRYLTSILLVLLALGGIFLMLDSNLPGVAAVAAAAVAVSSAWKWADTRCPHCRRGFALGAPRREELDREEVQLQDTIQYRADEVRSNFSHDCMVKGTRILYREERTCRRCGKTVSGTVVVSKKHGA